MTQKERGLRFLDGEETEGGLLELRRTLLTRDMKSEGATQTCWKYQGRLSTKKRGNLGIKIDRIGSA